MSFLDRPLRRRFAMHWLFLAGVVVTLAALIAANGYFDHERVDAAERHRLLAQARVVAINLEHQLAATDNAINSTLEGLPRWRDGTGYSASAPRRLKAVAEIIPGIRTFLVTDPEGTALTSNRDELVGSNFSQREWFQTAKQARDPGRLHLSQPFVTVLGVWGMNLSRMIPGPNGEFAGVIAVTLAREYFQTLLGSINYAPDGRASVFHGDGKLFAMVPDRPELIGRSSAVPGSFFTRHVASGKRESVLVGAGALTKDGRMAGLVTLSGEKIGMDKPLVVTVSRDSGAVFAEWRRGLAAHAVIFVALALAGATVVKLYQRNERRHLRAAAEASRKTRQCADAFANCAHGIGIGVPATGRMLTCNPAFARMLGRTIEEVTGSILLNLYHPSEHERIQRCYREADRAGHIRYQSRMVRKDGTVFPVDVDLTTVKDESGNSIYRVASVKDVTEENKIKTTLMESEKRFKSVFEEAPLGMALIDSASGRYLQVNPRLCQIVGYSEEDMLNFDFMAITHPDDLQSDLSNTARMNSKEISGFQMDKRYLRKDGSVVWVRLRVVPLGLDAVSARIHLAMIEDITARKTAETALQFLSTGVAHLTGTEFFNVIASQVALVLETEIGFVSRLLAFPVGRIQFIATSVDGQIVPPMTYDLSGTPCEQVIANQATIVPEGLRQRFPAGSFLSEMGVSSYAALPLLSARGLPIGTIGVMSRHPLRNPERIENVLQLFALRAAAELERQQHESQFHDLFEFSPDGILLVDQEGRVVLANQRAEDLFGYTGEEILRLTVEDLMPEANRRNHVAMRHQFFAAPAVRLMGARETFFLARRKDGTTIPVAISLGPIHSDDGSTRVIAQVRDITERLEATAKRRALEAQLHQSQKMEAVGRLTGGVAHDFNNLLQVIVANAEVAALKLPADAPLRQYIARITQAAARAAELTNRMLAFSRQQSLEARAVDLGELVAGLVSMLERTLSETIEIKFAAPGASPTVLADPGQLESALLNLAVNARDAMPEGGRLTIEVDTVTLDADGAARCGDIAPGTYGVVVVSDSGSGMPPEVQARVFEPFFTTKEVGKGTGLGLSMVYGFAKQSGGHVSIESKPGLGTTVRIFLPATEAKAAKAGASAPVPDLPGGRETVLVVEDNALVRDQTVEFIRSLGYRVIEAKDGPRALISLATRPDIDLLFTDLIMPGGMDGRELAEKARVIKPTLKVLYTSGYAEAVLGRDIRGAELLSKPYKPHQLAAALRASLDLPPA